VSKTSTKRKRPHAIRFPDEGMTRQSFKDECDVNNIVKTFTQTGMINHIPRTQPQYGDAPEIDFFEAARTQAAIRSQQEAGTLDLDELGQEPEQTPEDEPKGESGAPEAPESPAESTAKDGDS